MKIPGCKFILVSLLSVYLSVQAADKTLKQNMKELAVPMKLVQKTVTDSQQNSANANECEKMIGYLILTGDQTPKYIQSLPKEQQPKALDDYKDMTQQTIDRIKELKELFLAGDNKGAEAKVVEIIALKNKGHKTFDP